MSKPVLFAVAAAAWSALAVGTVLAGHGHGSRCCNCCNQAVAPSMTPVPAGPMAVPPAPEPPAPGTTAAAGQGTTTRSFSFEPAATSQPVMVAPMAPRHATTRFYDNIVRGDRKFLGHY